MKPDLEKYRHFMAEFDLPEQSKDELIHTMWQIMEGFADRAFELDNTQRALASKVSKFELGDGPVIELQDYTVHSKPLKPAFGKASKIKKGERH